MMKKKLQFLLIGKTGHGKSATGNSLLNRRSFRSSAAVESVTKDVVCNYSQFESCRLLVIDSPGMIDTNLDKEKDIEVATQNMSVALGMCNGGVDAFLVVLKFGMRFTAEERAALDSLRGIFGKDYLNHAIIVMSHGDLFHDAMEEEEGHSITFQEWCQKQTGEMKRLYEECRGRFVLFNNREKEEVKKKAQINQIVRMAERLQERHGRYTYTSFENAKKHRERLISQQQHVILSESIQESVSLLVADIDMYTETPSNMDKESITRQTEELIQETELRSKGSDSLLPLRELAEQVKSNLNNSDVLRQKICKMESIRRAKDSWSKIPSQISFVDGVFVLK